jgi:hypothetical protein
VSSPLRVAVVPCAAFPELGASDALRAAALRDLGAEVRVVQWNGLGDPVAELSGADAAVLRCPWDYPRDVPGFLRWLDAVERAGVPLLNTPALVRWNLDKRYLLDLAHGGVAVPQARAGDGRAAGARDGRGCRRGKVSRWPS